MEMRFPESTLSTLLIGTFLLLVGLGIVACDQLAGPSGRVSPSKNQHAEGALPDSTVLFLRVGPEASLLPPGADQRLTSDAVSRSQPTRSSENRTSGSAAGPTRQAASPYGCVMSTPNLQGEAAYRYEAVYAFFPKQIVEEAEGDIEQHRFSLSHPVRAPDSSRTALVLRQARCRIPASAAAKRLTRKRLLKGASPPSSWKGVTRHLVKSAPPLLGRVSSKSSCDLGEELEAVYVCSQTCVYGCENAEVHCEYVMRCVQKSQEPEENNGGSCDALTGNCGDDPAPCNADGGTSDQLCESGGGSIDPQPSDTTSSSIPCQISSDEISKMFFAEENSLELNTFKNLIDEFGGQFGLDSKAEVKHFMAQVAFESGYEITSSEEADFSEFDIIDQPEVRRDEEERDGDEIYKFERVMDSKRLQFSVVYDDRDQLGNGEPSTYDGWKFRGRGPTQLTGRYNYEQFNGFYQNFASKQGWNAPDLLQNPEKVSGSARIGTIAALNYWKENVDGEIGNNPTVKEVTEAINGGKNGLKYRRNQTEKAGEEIDCNDSN